ncbi:MAG: sigma-70 family RNA polymerase sigma factor [Planctomycetales bacterium]
MVFTSNTRDKQRLTRLWIEAQPRVFSFVCAAVARRHDAEDLLQQVALETARSFDNYDPQRPFLPWVLTIARRQVIRFYEGQGKELTIFTPATLEMLADHHAGTSTAEDERQALAGCVDQLDAKSRRLLGMRYDDNLSSTSMAQRAGLTTGSVRVILSRIRKQLVNCVRGKLAGETL